MPKVDEAVQDRETYGEPTGWSPERMRPVAEGAAQPPQPAMQLKPASDPDDEISPAPEQPSQEPVVEQQLPPANQPTPQEDVPFNQHPRWIQRSQELAQERARAAALERQNAMLLDTMQRIAPQQPQQVVAQSDPWEGLVNHPDPQTAMFYQQQKRLMDSVRHAAKQEAVDQLQPLIQAGMAKLAAIDVREFRANNPDIAPGSEEEQLVIAYMEGRVDGIKHPIESARNNAVIRRLETENRALKGKQQAVGQKRAAAQVESGAGIPASNGLPQRTQTSEDRARQAHREGRGIVDIARAYFGRG